mmetsp:Transcript_9191/g.14483  ORF Transcript_9191/g.14483 Transcript_9191/m.14483 type:complete len:231 (+) Transcript_9191:71-763(+)
MNTRTTDEQQHHPLLPHKGQLLQRLVGGPREKAQKRKNSTIDDIEAPPELTSSCVSGHSHMAIITNEYKSATPSMRLKIRRVLKKSTMMVLAGLLVAANRGASELFLEQHAGVSIYSMMMFGMVLTSTWKQQQNSRDKRTFGAPWWWLLVLAFPFLFATAVVVPTLAALTRNSSLPEWLYLSSLFFSPFIALVVLSLGWFKRAGGTIGKIVSGLLFLSLLGELGLLSGYW